MSSKSNQTKKLFTKNNEGFKSKKNHGIQKRNMVGGVDEAEAARRAAGQAEEADKPKILNEHYTFITGNPLINKYIDGNKFDTPEIIEDICNIYEKIENIFLDAEIKDESEIDEQIKNINSDDAAIVEIMINYEKIFKGTEFQEEKIKNEEQNSKIELLDKYDEEVRGMLDKDEGGYLAGVERPPPPPAAAADRDFTIDPELKSLEISPQIINLLNFTLTDEIKSNTLLKNNMIEYEKFLLEDNEIEIIDMSGGAPRNKHAKKRARKLKKIADSKSPEHILKEALEIAGTVVREDKETEKTRKKRIAKEAVAAEAAAAEPAIQPIQVIPTREPSAGEVFLKAIVESGDSANSAKLYHFNLKINVIIKSRLETFMRYDLLLQKYVENLFVDGAKYEPGPRISQDGFTPLPTPPTPQRPAGTEEKPFVPLNSLLLKMFNREKQGYMPMNFVLCLIQLG